MNYQKLMLEELLFIFQERVGIWDLSIPLVTKLGTSDKAVLYAYHKARDGPANLTQHCRLGIDSVFVQSLVRSLQHDNVLFHAGTNVCDTTGVFSKTPQVFGIL